MRGFEQGARVKVAFYGRLAEAVGPELEIQAAPGYSIAELRDKLIAEHPQAEEALRSKRARACVGNALVHDSYVLSATDRVEFLPPVSGG
jgi:molybdopterin converting factor small subunit